MATTNPPIGGTIADGDIANSFLQHLFSLPSATGVPAGHSIVLDALSYISGMVTVAASVFLSYNIFAGVAQTAHQGQVLGQRWSSLWGPIRVTTGLALLIPNPAGGGLCVAQTIAILLAQQGIVYANGLWALAVNDAVLYGTAILTPAAPNATALVTDLFRAQTCANIVQAEVAALAKGGGDPAQLGIGLLTYPGQAAPASGALGARTVSNYSDYYTRLTYDYGPVCGKIEVSVTNTATGGTNSSLFRSGSSGVAAGLYDTPTATASDRQRPAIDPAALKVLAKAQVAAADALQAALTPIAANAAQSAAPILFGTTTPPAWPDGATIGNAASAYTEADVKAMTTALGNVETTARDNFKKTAVADGFASAGSLYYTLANINRRMEQQGIPAVSVTAGKTSNLPAPVKADLETYLGTLDTYLGAVAAEGGPIDTKVASLTQGNPVAPPDPQSVMSEMRTKEGVAAHVKDLKGSKTINISLGLEASDYTLRSDNPMAEISSIGSRLAIAGETMIVAVAAANGVARSSMQFSVAGALGAFAFGVLETFRDWVSVISGFFVSTGAYLHVYLPMVPYTLWTIALFGWFLFVVEVVFMAPFWAFTHVRLDGEGIAGESGRQGYMMMFNLVVRPTLMVAGLITGYGVFQLFASLVTKTFFAAQAAFETTQSSILIGPTEIIMSVVVLIGLYTKAMDMSFSLIVWLPDRVAEWIGAQMRSMGEGQHQDELDRGGKDGSGSLSSFTKGQNTALGVSRRDQKDKPAGGGTPPGGGTPSGGDKP